MPERKTGFLGMAVGLLALAFAIGFALSLASAGKADILDRFALPWELCGALLYLAAWSPAVLLVSAALAMEGSKTEGGFAGTASLVLMPAMALAAAVSIFYLLLVPMIEDGKARYEGSSRVFEQSLVVARDALDDGDWRSAEEALFACRAIDPREERYVELDGLVKSAMVRAAGRETEAAGALEVGQAEPADESALRAQANRFYLEAKEAQAAGRLFDAHYLARRSAALYGRRPEVQRLVDETWRDLQRLGPSKEDREASDFYRRKLEGYQRFQEGDYLAAYRIYTELKAQDGSDKDVSTYLARSEEGLSTIAFFIEEDEKAFERAAAQSFRLSLDSGTGPVTVEAVMAVAARDAVYFRDVVVRGGDFAVRASRARLHGDTLIVRAVDRADPRSVWNPVYEKGDAAAPGYALRLPFSQDEAAEALVLSGDPGKVPIAALATGIARARRFGVAIEPLLEELAMRSAYPFIVIMLVLLGAGLGVRFKPTEPPTGFAKIASAPFLVALAMPPLSLAADVGPLVTGGLARWLPTAAYLPAWLGFLGALTALCLFLAARIASHAPTR